VKGNFIRQLLLAIGERFHVSYYLKYIRETMPTESTFWLNSDDGFSFNHTYTSITEIKFKKCHTLPSLQAGKISRENWASPA
jgi:hypothetical protein